MQIGVQTGAGCSQGRGDVTTTHLTERLGKKKKKKEARGIANASRWTGRAFKARPAQRQLSIRLEVSRLFRLASGVWSTAPSIILCAATNQWTDSTVQYCICIRSRRLQYKDAICQDSSTDHAFTPGSLDSNSYMHFHNLNSDPARAAWKLQKRAADRHIAQPPLLPYTEHRHASQPLDWTRSTRRAHVVDAASRRARQETEPMSSKGQALDWCTRVTLIDDSTQL